MVQNQGKEDPEFCCEKNLPSGILTWRKICGRFQNQGNLLHLKKTVPELPDLEEFVDLDPDLMEPGSVLCVTSAYEGFCGPPLRNTS